MDTALNNIKNIIGMENIPEREVRVEKKEQGLYERTKESTILITEDNKMILND